MKQFVGMVLVKTDGSVLSQHRDDIPTISGSNTWCVVGGAREEIDESLEDTAVRELFEETGLNINPDVVSELTSDTYWNEFKKEKQQRTIYWAMYNGNDEIKLGEGQEIRFINPIEFTELKFYTGHEDFLRMASEKAFSGGVEIKQG